MSIQDYLPKKSPHITSETTVVTGRVPIKMAHKVRDFLTQDNLSWADFLSASMIQYLNEKGVKIDKDNKKN